MKKIIRIIAVSLGCLILVLAAAVGGFVLHSKNYAVPEQPERIENTTGLVQARGRALYDPQGKLLQLQGINAGQLLLQEGWMSPFALEPSKNSDGSYVKDGDGNLQYPDFSEETFRAGIQSNPNLQEYSLARLQERYRECFFTEEDFRIIKEELGLNTIRLPFFYLDILREDLTVKPEAEAFAYLDWFIERAAERELYIVLDLHGAPGSQSGYEHSGTDTREAGLWNSQANIDATVALWEAVSGHYTRTRPDLGSWIATYDLLNEPTYTYKGVTTRECWEVFDRIYDTIRAQGDRHVITMESCWDFARLPDPAEYGWENVQYEYHWYNWANDVLPYDLFYAYQDLSNIGRDYEVPVLIGEFTFFEDREAWAQGLALFDQRGYSWTVWSYKTSVTGWWTSSWGVYTCQLKLQPGELKCNVATCTFDEYMAVCEQTRTSNCVTGTLYEVLIDRKMR